MVFAFQAPFGRRRWQVASGGTSPLEESARLILACRNPSPLCNDMIVNALQAFSASPSLPRAFPLDLPSSCSFSVLHQVCVTAANGFTI